MQSRLLSKFISKHHGNVNFANPNHLKEYQEMLDAEVARENKKVEEYKPILADYVTELKKYVNCAEFTDKYTQDSLDLVAEASHWAVQLGLDKLFAKMSYAEIRQFKPIEERHINQTERSALIDEVCKQLKKPSNSFEASYALGQAAWCAYIHYNSYDKVKEEGSHYEAPRSPRP